MSTCARELNLYLRLRFAVSRILRLRAYGEKETYIIHGHNARLRNEHDE